jgi:hypothetical protein
VTRQGFKQVKSVHVGGLIEHEEAELAPSDNVSGSALATYFLVAGDRDPSAPTNVGDPLLVGTVICEVAVEICKAGRPDQL